MNSFQVRFIHKISQNSRDVRYVAVPENAFATNKTLGAALRKCGVLLKGEQIKNYRQDGEKYIATPSGCTGSVWHALVLTPLFNSPDWIVEAEA